MVTDRFHPSRATIVRLLVAMAAIGYFGATLALLDLVARMGGAALWLARALVVFGATFAAMTLLPQGTARAWLKLKVAKHLFRHRYDYRVAWLRLTATLSETDGEEGGRPLPERIERALAEITDSPAALLFVAGPDGTLAPRTGDIGTLPAALFAGTPRTLDCDALRLPHATPAATPDERAAAPAWLLADRRWWAGVPLLHGDRLAGLVLLGRPPVDRRLDWEDHDLLAAAGHQAASHLAEAQGQEALAEARRFHEFNRRFAFIVHDVKNLASQLGLVAHNAERHADNPAFRADMVATLKDSVARLTDLLGRLSPQQAGRVDPPRAAAPMAVLRAIAERRRAQHPVRLTGSATVTATIDPARLGLAVDHLVQNAIEASAAGAAITLSVERQGGEVAVIVADTGRGMDARFVRERLFAPFATTKAGGFGIGAGEARALVIAMGGRIEVESIEGVGTRFTLLFPAAAQAELAA